MSASSMTKHDGYPILNVAKPARFDPCFRRSKKTHAPHSLRGTLDHIGNFY